MSSYYYFCSLIQDLPHTLTFTARLTSRLQRSLATHFTEPGTISLTTTTDTECANIALLSAYDLANKRCQRIAKEDYCHLQQVGTCLQGRREFPVLTAAAIPMLAGRKPLEINPSVLFELSFVQELWVAEN